MAVIHLGSKTLGAINVALNVTALPALIEYLAELTKQFGALSEQITHYARLAVTVPDPVAELASILDMITGLAARIAEILAGRIPLAVSATADLTLAFGLITARLNAVKAIVDGLTTTLGAGGVHAYKIDSTNANIAADISAALAGGLPGGGGPTARVQGVMFVTESPSTFTTMSTVLLTA